MQIIVKCPIHFTEDIDRVQKAIENIFGDIPLRTRTEEEHSELFCTELTPHNLSHLRQIVHDKRIIDAVRVRLLRNRDEFTSAIYFDKQAAFVSKVRLIDNTNEDPPLGSIEVRINYTTDSDFEKFLHWFTPPTTDGRIIA